MDIASDDEVRARPDSRALFLAFLKVGVTGFGGVMPFAHRMLVHKERWLTEREFMNLLALCQFLPGPNIVNLSIIVGRQFDGPRGACAAFTGLILMPMVIILILGALYGTFGHVGFIKGAFGGVASAAAGLVIAMAVRIGSSIRTSAWQMVVAAIVFVLVALLRLPLVWVLAGTVPIALLIAAREKKS